ncbi:hypothetical protein [Pseudomonas putida]|uniref:Uncharacterized protein n=1 Tax=Pseudomonas putida TaxID=303 RepID=A0AAW4BR86_PSEPU|nr:hypothetical protein [Pseudomonas putida]MBF8702512.1 hypothetical protein [Pseudomonas putida]MBF8735351.1 hypothetical protein [Pseudomonas putida]
MTWRDSHELVPGLALHTAYEAALRRRLVDIDDAATPVNCLIAQARAEGIVECLETVTHGIPAGHTERLYLVIEDATNRRLAVLGAMQCRPGGGFEHLARAGQHPQGARGNGRPLGRQPRVQRMGSFRHVASLLRVWDDR